MAGTKHLRVNTYTETMSVNTSSWKLPFNQVCFINYDPNSAVQINTDILLQPAVLDTTNSEVYPTYLEIALNTNEVNDSNFNFNFFGSTTAKLVIVHTEYNEGLYND